jgi:hypothetical protein
MKVLICVIVICLQKVPASPPQPFHEEASIVLSPQAGKGKKRLIEEEGDESTEKATLVENLTKNPKLNENYEDVMQVDIFQPQLARESIHTIAASQSMKQVSFPPCPQLLSKFWRLIIKYAITDYIHDSTLTDDETWEVDRVTPSTYYSLAKPYGTPARFYIEYNKSEALKMRSVSKKFYDLVNGLYSLPINPKKKQLSDLQAFKQKWKLPTHLDLTIHSEFFLREEDRLSIIREFSSLMIKEGPLILKGLTIRCNTAPSLMKQYFGFLHHLSGYSTNLAKLSIHFSCDDRFKGDNTMYELVNEGIQALCSLVDPQKTPQLEYLELDEFFDHTDEVLVGIYSHLRDHRNLKILNFLYTNASNVGAVHLAEALRSNQSIRAIVMQENKISEAGIYAILFSLYHNNTLESLDLTLSLPISKSLIEPIFKCLEQNKTLRELGIDGHSRDKADDATEQDRIDAYDLREHRDSLLETLPEGEFRERLKKIVFFNMRY